MLAVRALPCAAQHTSSNARLLLAARPAGVQRRRRCAARAAPPQDGSGSGNDAPAPLNDLLLANSGQPCPVPREQQPINELAQLAADEAFELARAPAGDFAARLARDFFAFFTVIGLPVSAFTFDLATEPAQFVLAAACGSLFVVTILVMRVFLGWQHVGARLQAAAVEYEETGWYDGATWVKTPEMLARDRLAFAYQIRPAIARLKSTLVGLGSALAASLVLLAALPPPQAQSAGGLQQQVLRVSGGGGVSSGVSSGVNSAAASSADGDELDYEERLAAFEPWVMGPDHFRAPSVSP